MECAHRLYTTISSASVSDVGINDLLELLAHWGASGSCDFDGGNVGITDLLALLGHWERCP